MSSTVVHASFLPSSPTPVYSAGYPRRRRQAPPPLGLQKVQESALAAEAALRTGGLQTPPADDNMSMAYSSAMLSNTYDSHVALARQLPNALAQPSRNAVILCDALHQFPRVEQQPQQHAQYQQQIYLPPTLGPQPPSTSSRHSTRPSTPSSTCTIAAHSEGTISRRDSTMVTHNLQLPSCISPDGGNLDEFAATMTCFFWFETMDTIQVAERLGDRRSLEPIPPLSSHSEPCSAYLKWVNTILSTTQVTQNVILLALLFVYRLKKSNPKVNGNPGSEYRLLTVALMLSNKFLDDNTYTNKTWAEVSCIPVKEIHVMEVEFLSNMRYGLLTSKEQWQEWLQKLACYREYYERAKMERKHCQAPPLPAHMPSGCCAEAEFGRRRTNGASTEENTASATARGRAVEQTNTHNRRGPDAPPDPTSHPGYFSSYTISRAPASINLSASTNPIASPPGPRDEGHVYGVPRGNDDLDTTRCHNGYMRTADAGVYGTVELYNAFEETKP
ncbi:hypothetical protein DL766_001033 [Monosporascus sp. MC13-8B]|uniref:Cyclin N-terminal domain-containing protein n=1 Tax=Monosporascus cannonballus TaxID=155416 RepID=A0ABY0H6S5_9PEZI|nr:hypothetical protein DL762_004792 [Monosporascus cannonballus]RYP38324.1 hypothetical protein DL766_001033 [Monosporascus sp. MC13-8B]